MSLPRSRSAPGRRRWCSATSMITPTRTASSAAWRRAGTEHHTLCVGDLEKMTTDTKRLLEAGLDLAAAAWKDAVADFDWADGMDRYIIHQVSSVHTRLICERLGDRPGQGAADLPAVRQRRPGRHSRSPLLACSTRSIAGERVLCMGIGSGLNTSFTEIVW